MADDIRENRMLVVSGKQRIGKSNETIRNLFDEVIPVGRKGLILDINNEYEQYKVHYGDGTTKIQRIKRILHNDIRAFSQQTKIEVCRVLPVMDNGRPMTNEEIDKFWVRAIRLMKGAAVLMEDMNNVFSDSLPKKLTTLLTNKAHRDGDLIFHVQSVGRLLPKIRQNAEYVRFHYQLDPVASSKGKLSDEYPLFAVAENIIKKQYLAGMSLIKINKSDAKGNRLIRKFVYINREEKKIMGAFSKRMMYEACVEYLKRNPDDYSFFVKQVDSTGKKAYTPQAAIHARALELLQSFYGN